MRLYLAGQKAFGAAVFEAVRKEHQVVGVSAPAWRANGLLPDRLRDAVETAGVPWLEAGQLRADLMPDGVDLIVCAHSHDFIGRKTRLKTRLGAIGYHPSLLPRHRGRDAVRWTVHMGDPVAGGSIYWLTDSVDAGPIAAQEHVLVAPGETPERLWRDNWPRSASSLRSRRLSMAPRYSSKVAPQNSPAGGSAISRGGDRRLRFLAGGRDASGSAEWERPGHSA